MNNHAILIIVGKETRLDATLLIKYFFELGKYKGWVESRKTKR